MSSIAAQLILLFPIPIPNPTKRNDYICIFLYLTIAQDIYCIGDRLIGLGVCVQNW